MKFLITGVDGFVGPHLARRLLMHGHKVYGSVRDLTCVDNYVDGIEYLEADLRDEMAIDELFWEVSYDGVFHLASRTHPPTSFQEPIDYFKTNALGAIRIAESIRRNQPDCVLMNCSTSETYGIHPEGTRITEKTVCVPQNPYAVSKHAADIYIQERANNGLLKAFITKAFSHTGPGRPKNYSISSDAYQLARIIKGKQDPIVNVGNLSCKRIVMDVRDVVFYYYKLMMNYTTLESTTRYGEVWNIAGVELKDMNFFFDTMCRLFGLEVEKVIDEKLYRKFDIPIQHPDSTKIKMEMGWSPKYSIEETLRDLIDYWLERV